MIEKIDSNVLKKLGKYQALGFAETDIADELNDEFNLNLNQSSVHKLLKAYTIRRTEILKSDNEVAKIYESILRDIVNEVKDNITLLKDTTQLIKSRLEKLEENSPDAKLIAYHKEINLAIRTQNDSVRTMNELLKRLAEDKKEIKVSTIQAVQMTVSQLKNLENQGFIKILPRYKFIGGDHTMSEEEQTPVEETPETPEEAQSEASAEEAKEVPNEAEEEKKEEVAEEAQ